MVIDAVSVLKILLPSDTIFPPIFSASAISFSSKPPSGPIRTPIFIPVLISFNAESEEIERYLRGEQLTADADFRGYGVVAVNGYPLGLCKVSGTAVKNHYPKGLRLLK